MWRKIHTSFWSDPKVRKLDANGKLLFLHLITNSHAHVSGIYQIPRCTLVHETGIQDRVLDTLCDTLSSSGLARFDWNFEVIWVVNMLKHQGDSPKVFRSAEIHLDSLHNCPLIKDFCAFYPQIKYEISDRVSDRVSSPGQVCPQEQDQEKKDPPLPPGGGKRERTKSLPEAEQIRFDKFWAAYPRKTAKGKAEKAWGKIRPDDLLLEKILAAVASQRNWHDWIKQDGEFIPYPATWLNDKHWMNEQPKPGNGGSGQAVPAKPPAWEPWPVEKYLKCFEGLDEMDPARLESYRLYPPLDKRLGDHYRSWIHLSAAKGFQWRADLAQKLAEADANVYQQWLAKPVEQRNAI